MTKGTSSSKYGSNDIINGDSFFTFILRALGYNDILGDFKYNQALDFAYNNSLIGGGDYSELKNSVFIRDLVAKYSYLAFKMKLKDEKMSLAGKLVENGSLHLSLAQGMGLLVSGTNYELSVWQNEKNQGIIYWLCRLP